MFTSFARAAWLTVGLAAMGMAASAQSFDTEPANLPPADFEGDSYVDNDGCIFLRAGFNGNTTWVPRVTRSRDQVCGQEPTFAGGPTRVAETDADRDTGNGGTREASTDDTLTATADADRGRTDPAATDSTAPERTAARAPETTTRPAPQPATVTGPPNDRPRIVRPTPVRPSHTRAAVPAPRYGATVRARSATAPAMRTLDPDTRLSDDTWIVPRHVYEARDTVQPRVPHGYEPAWEDGRLNRYRAWQKAGGYRATQRLWTNTVPRRAVDPGEPVEIRQPSAAYRVVDRIPREQIIIRDYGAGVTYVPMHALR